MAHAPSTPSSLGHLPRGDQWTFDQSVTHVFDDMLRRSIPQYDVMRRAVFDVGLTFVQPGTHVVDLGCARGEALAWFVEVCGGANRYIGIDSSQPMIAAARQRFAAEIDSGVVCILNADLRETYPDVYASLTLCVLTLQFTPMDCRPRIVGELFRTTAPGGAVILVEKLRGSSAELDRMLIANYHALKSANGYTAEEIERKRLALEGVLVPATAGDNEGLLVSAGFEHVECFWRWMNFAAWVAVRRPEPDGNRRYES